MPLTSTGFVPRTLAESVTALSTALRSTISSKLVLTERTVIGNVMNILADHIDQVEGLQGEVYNAFDPDNATDDRVVALNLLRGVPRRGAEKGRVTATINLDAGGSIAAGGLVAHVVGDETNRWVNKLEIPAHGSGDIDLVFESEAAGSQYIAPAGSLSEIATPVSGWNSITNALDAVAGTDIEPIERLRLRGELATASGGSRTRNALRAQLVNLDGVLSAEVFENQTDAVDANGLPPKSFRAVVWDGIPNAVNNDAIAQVILDFQAEGILSDGNLKGTAVDDAFGNVTVPFRRATASQITVSINVTSAVGVSEDDVKDAIIAAMPTRVGSPVVYNKIGCAAFEVPGVDDFDSLTINGGTADLPGAVSTIYLLSSGNISVSGDLV